MDFGGTGEERDVSIIFDSSKLTIARQLAGLRKGELAQRIGMKPATVSAWESGNQQPTAAALSRLALALGVGVQFFSFGGASSKPLLNAPHFRSLRSTTQRAQDQAAAFGRLASDIAAMFERTLEFPPSLVPHKPVDGFVATPGAAEDAARYARERLGLAPGPVPHLVRLMEQIGVLVVFSPPQTASIDAFSFEGSGRAVIVLNPEKDDYYRQRFDVAHEFGHLTMHLDSEPGGRTVEDQASRFAAEFLMPAEEIRPHLPTSTTRTGWSKLAALKEHWGVSIASLLYRGRTLGVMSDVSYRNAMISLSQKGWRRAEPGHIKVLEMPSLLPRAVELLESAGVPGDYFVDAAGLPRATFEVVVSRTPARWG